MMMSVLDKGYIRLVDTLGSDSSIVNAARASYDKESLEFSEKDQRLLEFLIREGHLSPLRHAAITLEVYAPLMVARQWWKYAVSSTHLEDMSGWNESSRRYITENEEFYIPEKSEWRNKPENSKQGSGVNLYPEQGVQWTEALEEHIDRSLTLYSVALEKGLAPEQARLFLPAYGMYVRWRWTVSLAAVLHFLDERNEQHAQFEIQEYARAVNEIVCNEFPAILDAWRKMNV